ncbi:ABC transporter ATP-binding protein [candidate division KSB1 bacterium 4484_188]|nr:MAG: ABC transporter ATP-binding protein [candidate division KSB1 bacterium 4484_188]HFE63232.1 ABC transporter ATP-binding protein [Caldithrix sp.]
MEEVIQCKNLTHYYGAKLVFENMNFTVKRGSIFGLLGKNGTGKTTTINILNGFLQPTGGECLIFGENTQALSPPTKAKIGFLMEGHIQYSFMNIFQIEKFYSAFYPDWKKEPYYELMKKLEISQKQKISKMSCGQRSQVALGLILAQDPELMILDDYSMGLDPGYRQLFIDYLSEYAKAERKTIFVTSHIIQDMERLIDDMVVLDYRSILLSMSPKKFMDSFKQYRFEFRNSPPELHKDEIIKNFDIIKNHATVYTFAARAEIENYLRSKQIQFVDLQEIPMSLESAFIGLTGKY